MRDLALGRMAGVNLLAMAASLALSGSTSAETLVLKDGAVIHGEIKTLQGDVYTVETELLGTVRVRKQDVRTIEQNVESTAGSSLGSSPGSPIERRPETDELQAIQTRMLQSPSLFSLIEALRSDPEIQAVLADPEIMSAVASGNYAALMNHPKIIALTRNANVREIIDEAQ